MLGFAIIFISSMPIVIMAADDTYIPCNSNCVDEASTAQLATTKLRLFRESVDDYTEVPAANALSLLQGITKTKKTVVYVYGWTGELFLNEIHTNAVITAFLKLKSHNVLLLNWNSIAFSEYTFAARSTNGVGWILARALNQLVSAGLNKSSLHLIGHSMGAQVCGFTGRYVNFRVPRITGLDPAGPLFNGTIQHLTFADASFVDIIHTDMGVIGIDAGTGHVDYYPNGGRNIQPGCLLGLDICSHYRSVNFFTESVLNSKAFIGRECNSYPEFLSGLCSLNPTAVMGYHTPITTRGNFYLKTNRRFPYGQREDGAS